MKSRENSSKYVHRVPVDVPGEVCSRLGACRCAVEVDSLPDVEQWRFQEGPRVDLHQFWCYCKGETEPEEWIIRVKR